MFDLNLFHIHLINGQDQPDLPGLLIAIPPRRFARGREGDILVAFLASGNNSSFSDSERQALLDKLSAAYFSTSGSVTSALRASVEKINSLLLDLNLRDNGQRVGWLNLVALHGEILFLTQVGPGHAFTLERAEVQDCSDTQSRGLGISRSVNLRFFQSMMQAGDLLVISPEPPSSWNAANLANSPHLSLEHLRRRLLNQCGPDLQAVVVQFQPGKGLVHRLRPKTPAMAVPPQAGQAPASAPSPSQPRNAAVATQAPASSPSPSQPRGAAVAAQAPASAPSPSQPRNAAVATQAPASSPSPSQPRVLVAPPVSPVQTPLEGEKTTTPAPETPAASKPPSGIYLSGEPLERPVHQEREPKKPAQPWRISLFKLGQGKPEIKPAAPGAAASQKPAAGTVAPAPEKPVEKPAAEPARLAEQPSPQRTAGTATVAEPVHVERAAVSSAESSRAAETHSAPASQKTPKIDFAFKQKLASAWKVMGASANKANQAWKSFLGRVLPARTNLGDPGSTFSGLSRTSKIFISLAVPVAVVAASLAFYFRSGVGEKRQEYFLKAQEFASTAAAAGDQVSQRAAWSQTLYWLQQAKTYGETDEAISLGLQAQKAIDTMDGIRRVDFSPAVAGGFASNIQISQIAATSSDVYVLDKTAGRVIRLVLTGQGYDVDTSFSCGPGASGGGVIINPLVGMAAVQPSNPFKATVIALDDAGNMVFCTPGSGLTSQRLPAPDTNWGKITAFSYSEGSLFVLDPMNNAVFLLDGADLQFADSPRLFFGNEVPNLNDIVDMRANGDDLYLLHQNGQMSLCSLGSSLVPTRCNNPAPYGDQRPDHEASPTSFPDANFIQIQNTQAPDSSLYMLDNSSESIYHFSLRLNLQDQIRPALDSQYSLPKTAPTAFAMAPGHMVFMAFGNQIYYGQLP